MREMKKIHTIFNDKYEIWDEEDFDFFTKHATPLEFKKGDNILIPVDDNYSVFLLEKGSINMCYYTKDGDSFNVIQKNAGDFFGLKSLFNLKKEKDFYIQAASDVKCWKISSNVFMRLLEENPAFGRCVLAWFATYIGRIEKKLLNSAFLNSYQKLIVVLLENAEMTGENSAMVYETQQNIGEMLSLTRQTVAAYLTLLEENQMVRIHRGKIELLDMEGLKGEVLV